MITCATSQGAADMPEGRGGALLPRGKGNPRRRRMEVKARDWGCRKGGKEGCGRVASMGVKFRGRLVMSQERWRRRKGKEERSGGGGGNKDAETRDRGTEFPNGAAKSFEDRSDTRA